MVLKCKNLMEDTPKLYQLWLDCLKLQTHLHCRQVGCWEIVIRFRPAKECTLRFSVCLWLACWKYHLLILISPLYDFVCPLNRFSISCSCFGTNLSLPSYCCADNTEPFFIYWLRQTMSQVQFDDELLVNAEFVVEPRFEEVTSILGSGTSSSGPISSKTKAFLTYFGS